MANSLTKREGRLVIVSNRLPVVLQKRGGKWNAESGSGGLVTALLPVLRDRGGLWIGWPGLTEQQAGSGLEEVLAEASRHMKTAAYSQPCLRARSWASIGNMPGPYWPRCFSTASRNVA